MPTPISILIPIYNAESFLEETIDSVLCQTFSDFELLLLDDGSTDNSYGIIERYNDSRIQYIHSSHNFIKTLNKGISIASGKYIALLDHDDLMMPHRLQIQHDFLELNSDIIACGGYMHSFGKYSNKINAPLNYIELVKKMIVHSPMLNPTGFIRRETLIKHNIKYQRGYSFAADFKFWSDLIKVGKVVNIPKVLTLYRTSENQTSVVFGNESSIGAHKIQQEVIEYLLSLVKERGEHFEILNNKLIPGLDHFCGIPFFSTSVYFPLMYELIQGLINEGVLELKYK